MTAKLTDEQMDQLETWIGTGPKTFTLLYSIARDGCSAATFHQKCDNQGPTITVLYNPQGSVYGGYTSANWNSSDVYVIDDKAFLYQLEFSRSKATNKFKCINPQQAIYSHSGWGPIFGGHDMYTFLGNKTQSNGKFSMNGDMSSFGTTYDAHGVASANINNDSVDVTELEIYAVKDGQRQNSVKSQTKSPWRKTPEFNEKYRTQLKEELENFKPISEVGISEFRILMFGPIGSGKSSFYNTIDSIFRGRISHRAACGNDTRSTTTTYTPYTVRTKTGSKLRFRLCDTPGIAEALGPDILECNFLLDGHIPDFYEFNPNSTITLKSPEFVLKPETSETIHCVAFVIDASTVDKIPEKVIEKMKGFRKPMNQRRILRAVILTNIDKISQELNENVTNVFLSQEVKKIVGTVSALFGVPENSILPVKNYHSEMHLDSNVSILALMALQQLLYLAEDYAENLLMQADGQNSTVSEHEVTESDTA